MKLAMIGLGKMGMNMARRLMQGNHEVVAYDLNAEAVQQISKEGASGAASLQEIVGQLAAPRVVWIMLPAGKPVEETISHLRELLQPEDIIIDGGNSFYKDDRRRYETLQTAGIRYMDVGVSGGIWGLQVGYCMMVGGDEAVFNFLEPVFKTLAPKDGYLYCGKSGAGHFVKMVHNGIEYGLMQAYGEGFEILDASEFADSFDYAKIAHLWNQGSVIRSWLLELAEDAFSKSAGLTDISGFVQDSGEGRWTVQQAVDTGVPAEVITLSLMRRFRSRQQDPFSERVLAALRREFGGHAVVKKKT
ncbi:MAG: decarboxylating 6-phosphogluconate dehydrogenase [Deltaproteobacteria bacterium]|jgi:6-phosphogluconate dehydrogenase|nr:decarboxylating 6-phosphogluconate dehydrogenase [Deltaproteobacteria bacterium]